LRWASSFRKDESDTIFIQISTGITYDFFLPIVAGRESRRLCYSASTRLIAALRVLSRPQISRIDRAPPRTRTPERPKKKKAAKKKKEQQQQQELSACRGCRDEREVLSGHSLLPAVRSMRCCDVLKALHWLAAVRKALLLLTHVLKYEQQDSAFRTAVPPVFVAGGSCCEHGGAMLAIDRKPAGQRPFGSSSAYIAAIRCPVCLGAPTWARHCGAETGIPEATSPPSCGEPLAEATDYRSPWNFGNAP
jgi:hypothetical protein